MVFSYFCKYSQQQRAHLFPIYHGFCFVVNSTAWASGLLFHGATLAVAGAFREEERCNTFSVARKPQGSTRRAEDTSLSRGSKKTDNSLAERFVFDPDCQEAAEMDTAHSSTTSIDSLQPSQEYRQLGDVFAEENWEFAGRGEHFKIDLAEEEDFTPPSEHVEELLDTAAEGGAASKAAHKLANYIPFLRKKPHSSSAPTEHKLLGQWRATAIAGDYPFYLVSILLKPLRQRHYIFLFVHCWSLYSCRRKVCAHFLVACCSSPLFVSQRLFRSG